MKKRIVFISVLLTLILALSGCGLTSAISGPNRQLDGNGGNVQIIVDGTKKVAQNYLPPEIKYSQLNDNNMFAANVWKNKSQTVLNITSVTTLTNKDVYVNYNSFQLAPGGEVQKQTSAGSGFIITYDGFVITNAHVIITEFNTYRITNRVFNGYSYTNAGKKSRPADNIYASFESDDLNEILYYKLELIAYDTEKDLAILKFENSFEHYTDSSQTIKQDGFARVAEFFDSDNLVNGEPSIAIGNAQGYGLSVSTGIISRRYIQTYNAIMTTAPINPGNSGGPLFNRFSQVVGVNSSKLVNDATENMGFAIPSKIVMSYIDAVASQKGIEINYILV